MLNGGVERLFKGGQRFRGGRGMDDVAKRVASVWSEVVVVTHGVHQRTSARKINETSLTKTKDSDGYICLCVVLDVVVVVVVVVGGWVLGACVSACVRACVRACVCVCVCVCECVCV